MGTRIDMKWGYKRAFLRCVLLLAAGAVIQFLSGDVNPGWLRYPLGAILAINYIYLLIVLVSESDKWKWVLQLTDHHACISSLASMLAVTLVFGLTGRCGPSTWPFCIMLFYFMTTLGLRSIQEIRNWRKSRLMTTVIHSTVFIALTAAFFSSGDKVKVRIMAETGIPTHTGISSDSGQQTTIPFVLTLEEFLLDIYPDGTPKTFTSRVRIENRKGEKHADIRVNHPAKSGHWRIYQVGYDKENGAYSILECVKDGWYPIIQTCLWIILSTGMLMILTAGSRRRKEESI